MGGGASVASKAVPQWTSDDVRAYLEHEGLSVVGDKLKEQNVDGLRLMLITDEELDDLGVSADDKPRVLRLLEDLRRTLCLKQGPMQVKTDGMMASFNTRHAVLSGRELTFFADDSRQEEKNKFEFDQNTAVFRDYYCEDAHRVVLRAGDEEILLQLETAEAAEEWHEAIKQSMLQYLSHMGDDGVASLVKFLHNSATVGEGEGVEEKEPEEYTYAQLPESQVPVPPMTICIMIVGTRGDVQPFLALSKRLQGHGHRVRLATHAIYRDFVLGQGVEFYPLGGDPKKLSEHMTKTNGRLLPRLDREELAAIPEMTAMINEILVSTWPACTEPDPGLSIEEQRPFIADAIISNPVTYGHIHCAEALSVPLHIMFPQPWSPTHAFPHPLAALSYHSGWSIKNHLSYQYIDDFMWLGVAGMVNAFRKDVLGLDIIRASDRGGALLNDNRVPFAKLWSKHLVPSPPDWQASGYIDVVGGFYLDLAGSYDPSPELEAFLTPEPTCIFIGFGSVMIQDTAAVTRIIVDAAVATGVKVLMQSSWSTMEGVELPENVMVIGNCPHDWLFQRVAAVIHHGGAGTVAAGLRAARPTMVVPFFGDQMFWAAAVGRKMGLPETPFSELSVERLSHAFTALLSDEVKQRAVDLAALINAEDGVGEGMRVFHKHLPVEDMVCDVSVFSETTSVAHVFCGDCQLKLSREADVVIHADPGRASHRRKPYRFIDWGVTGSSNAASGALQGAVGLGHEVVGAVTGLISNPIKGAQSGGVLGFAKGVGTGLVNMITRPIRGGVVLLDNIATGAANQANSTMAAMQGRPCKQRRNVFLERETTSRHSVLTLDAVEPERRTVLLTAYTDALKAKKLFNAIDTSGDNFIQKSELLAHLTKLGVSRQQAEQAMVRLDGSRDGLINLAEFSILYKTMEGTMRRAVNTPAPFFEEVVSDAAPPPSGPAETSVVLLTTAGVDKGYLANLCEMMQSRQQRLVGLQMGSWEGKPEASVATAWSGPSGSEEAAAVVAQINAVNEGEFASAAPAESAADFFPSGLRTIE